MNTLDDLELELRKLPGVKAAGFDERDDMLLVQLHVGDRVDSPDHPVPVEASRIVARHVEMRSAVEIVRWRTIPNAQVAPPPPVIDVKTEDTAVTTQPDTPEPEIDAEPEAAVAPEPVPAPPPVTPAVETRTRRTRLLAVLAFPDTSELEVHLILDGRRTIGRSVSTDGLLGAVEATLAAVREIGAPFEPTPLWARAIESDDERAVVAVALGNVVADAAVEYGLAAGASPIDAAARSTLDALNRRLAQVL